ncbi:MAG: PQQ-dependent sugar dehydrogenase [Opitutaceae bacterium]
MRLSFTRTAALGLVAIVSTGFSQSRPATARPTEFECRFAIGPIAVDGVLNEETWKHAHVIDRFALPWLPDKPAARAQTRAKLLWDREYLYFAAELEDVDLFADILERDGKLWQNDVFELFFKPADDKPGYYEFHVTPAGTVLDAFFEERGKFEGVFKRGVRDDETHIDAKVKCDGTLNQRQDRDRGWTVEARIPWFDFLRTGGRPDVDETWKFALCRYDYTIDSPKPELSTCAPLTEENFHRYEDYATLRFLGPAAEALGPRHKDLTPQTPHPLAELKAAWPSVASRVVGAPEPPPPFRVKRVFPALAVSFPVVVVNEPGSNRLLFLDQERAYGPTRLCRTTDDPASGQYDVLLDIKRLCFDVTFHPRYLENGYLYVGGHRSDASGGKRSGVTRYTIARDPPHALDSQSAKVIIDWEGGGHSGCAMAFGPDGMFYVTSGDGSSDSDQHESGQRLDRLLAKVLRIDVDRPDEGQGYSVPKDNPFVGVAAARPETWAYGLRNPWRMEINQETGHVWVGNNGQDLWEQVYLVERGANYGWSVFEGSRPFLPHRRLGPTPVSKPIFEHHHSVSRSLTGGVVYRGKRLPELRGAYLYGDYATGKIWAAKIEGQRVAWHKEVADSTLAITAFALDAGGELLIADHQGDSQGGFYTLEPNDQPDRSGEFPRKLSETGLFASVAGHRLAPGLIPYSVNSPLWSDGAFKERALFLPAKMGLPGYEEPARIEMNDKHGWDFPDRTVLVKSFALETEVGNPQSRRWIETRLFTRQAGEWVGYSYEWNDAQTDATLVVPEGLNRTFEMRASTGGVKRQTWHYPSRAECMVCHSRAANFVLGPSTLQMNKPHDYGGVTANQLEALEYLGVLRVDSSATAKSALRERLLADGVPEEQTGELVARLIDTDDQRAPRPAHLLSHPANEYPRLADPYDDGQNLAARARSYLHANCAQCHVYGGGGNAQIDLRFSIPREKMKLFEVEPMHHTFGLENARLVAPGHPERSVLLHRVATRGPGQMPPLATSVVDEQAVELMREWIRQIK